MWGGGGGLNFSFPPCPVFFCVIMRFWQKTLLLKVFTMVTKYLRNFFPSMPKSLTEKYQIFSLKHKSFDIT